MSALRIMLVDDHPVVREGYRRLLERQGDLVVVAEAPDAATACRLLAAAAPDLVILDLSLSGADGRPESGIDAIAALKSRRPDLRVLIFSMHDDAGHAKRALAAGALGYVTKSSPPAELIRAVRELAQGRRRLSPDIAETLARERPDPAILARLSPREREILLLLLQGSAPDAIARSLGLSRKTIGNYHSLLRAKLEVESDIALLHRARALGIQS